MHISIILEQTEQQSWGAKDTKCHSEGWHQPAHITRSLVPSQDSTCSLLSSLCLTGTDDKLMLAWFTNQCLPPVCFPPGFITKRDLYHYYECFCNGLFPYNSHFFSLPLAFLYFWAVLTKFTSVTSTLCFFQLFGRQWLGKGYSLCAALREVIKCVGWQKPHTGWKRP